ncbi:shikimate dehydrogenase [Microbacterium sp. NPDC076895]|uniref:shikimate dehydrogenase family protein n=1 Tax=Microbacterium sp. NPDC076895 TaxID=3154957 RepID=UPI003437B5C1
MTQRRTRLEVWGDPIEHSRSPQLHAAAYRALGLDWSYERRRVATERFGSELGSLDDAFRGLSITYPLKEAAFAASVTRDARAQLTGAVNTLLLTGAEPSGFNTDVGGIVGSLAECGITELQRVRIVGAGATATSALVAVTEIGANHIEVAARRPDAVAGLRDIGERLGLSVHGVPLAQPELEPVDLTIAALPGGAVVADTDADRLASGGAPLFDVVYGQGMTSLQAAWLRAGHQIHTGEGMLLHQAVLQVRIFVGGDPAVPLRDETTVVGAMRSSLMGD